MKITGNWSKKLARMPQEQREFVGKAIFAGADRMVINIRRLIVQNAIQGKGHVRSRPGEPPNRETGDLDGSVSARRTGELSAEVFAGGTKAPHAVPLEFGTRKMAARPYMQPGAKMSKEYVLKLVEQAANMAIRSATR